MDYQTMRTFADSWGLLFMVIVFVAVVIYTFRPGSKKKADEIAQIPLKDDDDPNKDDKE
ncbi:cbb3-type cytochrome c oxidase subunit 3 [Nitratireductor sp. XY-223]|uniref:cbb3-type cytochrome oxidase subunit 3 n=1 Tax=Nitratireductor sp. XY-223 TaxID=2561926 RepID=UPI0010AA7DDF|nr:cbb3-type cytochrome c oxidase subunit 3 [Nitratireductor sp. XY-223]